MKRTFKYRKNYGEKVGKIEDLKNRWADNDFSPFRFWVRFIRPVSQKTYQEFLADLNYYEVWTSYISRASADFDLFLKSR